ncbi:hypothetical protein [Geobacter sp. AOG1]|uniref:hypothetical protein n=1 Tax=Geobacter sp. AOG1 TaxID=1566346 RepID=UPI001CC383CE|nr:hypothetical protein [Geobacter sp. AOG1]GFE56651.1 hypothetical protein AOG1_05300 [Geobacter sp. AOG1]
MACQLLDCCQLFKNLENFPRTAEYIREKLCLGDYESCSRFRIFKGYDGGNAPLDIDPNDEEAVKKVIRCMKKKRRSGD